MFILMGEEKHSEYWPLTDSLPRASREQGEENIINCNSISCCLGISLWWRAV